MAGCFWHIRGAMRHLYDDRSRPKTAAGFGIGHINLMTDYSLGPKEPFRAGKKVIREFQKIAGTFECQNITGRRFSGPSAFQEYVRASETCQNLMDRIVDTASKIIKLYQEDA